MNTLDRGIMIALLTQPQSCYKLEKEVRRTTKVRNPNYASVYRHIREMEKEGILTTEQTLLKSGSTDKRGTKSPKLTPKGLATLIFDGDLDGAELGNAIMKLLEKSIVPLPTELLGFAAMNANDILADVLAILKTRVNLKFFDEQHFRKTLTLALLESIVKQFKEISVHRGEKTKQKADKILKKHISQETIDSINEFYELAIAERSKYDEYAQFFGKALNAIRDSRGQ